MIRPLAVPLRARLDVAERLIEADPPLLRLHLAAGGTVGGELAIPQLFDLCRLTRKLGVGLSRPVLVADGNTDVSLWAETSPAPDDGGITLSVLGWRDQFADDRHQENMRADLMNDTHAEAGGEEDCTVLPPETEKTVLPFDNKLASALSLPLSRIVANAETIGNRLNGPLRESYAAYARDVADAARHLQELVNDLADLDIVERQNFSVEPDVIDLHDVVRRAAGLLSVKAADHHMTLRTDGSAKGILAIGEFRRVLQILVNLIGNAIRYSPDGSSITISVSNADGMAVASIADEGIGIPEDKREVVFEKFERLGRSGDGGSGLGLYISRRLARAMDGDLVVTSCETGGALFQLSLPLAPSN